MNMSTVERAPGHAFISYVREDADEVNRLQETLEAAGIRVWRDTEELWPGQDWKVEIRRAITANSLVFIACFSENSERRDVSYQNEELVLAAEQMRQRKPGVSWLIPARFSECGVPEFELGAGRMLGSIQRIDLFGKSREVGLARLVATVLRILGSDELTGESRSTQIPLPVADPFSLTKAALLAPERQIELEDLVTETTRSVRESLQDETIFPGSFPAGERTSADTARYVAGRISEYVEIVQPIAKLLIAGCTWGRAQHDALWARSMQGVANAVRQSSGNTALISIRQYPTLYLLYAGGLGAVHRKNFGALRALAIDAKMRMLDGSYSIINKIHPWRVFENLEIMTNILAFKTDGVEVTDQDIENLRTGRKGRRFTPVSDHLHTMLKEPYSKFIFDEEEYTETFDELEIILGLIAMDEKIHQAPGKYFDGPWLGAFSWRNRYFQGNIVDEVSMKLTNRGEDSPALSAGLFGGSVDRVGKAAVQFGEIVGRRRGHH